jgi:hypothetical protein
LDSIFKFSGKKSSFSLYSVEMDTDPDTDLAKYGTLSSTQAVHVNVHPAVGNEKKDTFCRASVVKSEGGCPIAKAL